MENSHKFSENQEKKRLIFSAASLIKRFDENPPLDETYNRAVGCYEVLLDLIKSPEVAKDISDLIKESQDKIRISALKIVNLLLFNDKKDPYMSLGLPNYATEDEIKRRWKKLLMLYHPDKMINVKKIDEVAKKINQAYREIKESQGKKVDPHYKDDVNMYRRKEYLIKKYSHVREQINKNPYAVPNRRYLKYLPVIILIIFISIAIFSIALFIINKIENSDNVINKQKPVIEIFTNIKL